MPGKKNMTNILILKFPHNSSLGGGEKHTLSLVKNLSKKYFNFYLVSSCNVLLEEFKKRNYKYQKVWLGLEPVSVKGLLIFTITLPYTFWRMFFLLVKYKIKYKVDILYCLNLTEKLLATIPAKILGYKIFWMEHLRIEKWLLKNPYQLFYISLSSLVTTITVSNSVKKQLTDLGLKENKVKVIYNGIDTNNFKPLKILDTKHEIQDIITIGSAGRLNTEKGMDYLIKAFKIVLEKYPNTRLHIAGQGPEENNLKKLVRNLNIENKVKFLGYLADKNIPTFYNKIDIFALTSIRRESFGLVAAEAGACEKSSVVTNISGLTEVVENDETGFVVKSKNIEAIAGALIKLIENKELREKFGRNARQRVLENFTEEKMIEEFEKIFVY
jgi:glycosyltransferase involved in cell wall biosynthesis